MFSGTVLNYIWAKIELLKGVSSALVFFAGRPEKILYKF